MAAKGREDYDVVVIGAGNAGQAAAGVAREAGLETAIIEGYQIGGVCPNRGCVPKKVLVAAAEALDVIARASAHHIQVGPAKLDFGQLIARKRELIGGLPHSMQESLQSRGIDVVRGVAHFVERGKLAVGDRTLSAKRFVIATGSKPRPLGFDGTEHLFTSDDFLEMDDLPETVLFVGAGVVAMEFAHVLLRAGSRVTVLEAAARPLAPFDADAVEQLTTYTRSLGAHLITEATVTRIAPVGGGYRVHWTARGENHERTVARVFHGAGRVAAVDQLGLEAAGIRAEHGRIELDEHLRSIDNPSVFVAGDALAGPPQLSPLATYEGRIAGSNVVSDLQSRPEALKGPDYAVVPSAVYTVPPLAMVGSTEERARENGHDVEVKVNNPAGWLSGKTYAEPVAFAKVVIDEQSDQLLGAHLLGHGATETIHVLALAMRCRVTATELKSQLYAYPTFTNDLKFIL